ncbi:MAG: OmpH family outer membrane protein [Planctomycetota bacterium]|nr:OmpH family outer membrane protein [Planctomycetota bacterium]
MIILRKTSLVFSCLVIVLGTTVLSAQQNVVVVDMGKIFREHVAFKTAIQDLQKDVETFKLTIQADRTKIQNESEILAGIAKSSPEYKSKEAATAKMAADMQVNHNMKNKEFMEQEAKLYYQTYVHVLTTIQSFCQQNSVSLVIRFSGEKIEPTNRASVLAGVNNVVVFQEKRDITDLIVKMVNQKSVANQNSGTGLR